jgi:YbbR-like protein
MRNLGLKLFSLLIAVLLAYFVHSDTNEGVVAISVPVELKGLPPQKTVVLPIIKQVQVSIKGPSFLLSQIYASPPAFHIKVPSDVGNRYIAKLSKSLLALPPGVDIMSIEPAEIDFTLDNLLRKEIPVQVEQFGAPPEGLKISELIVKPSRVTIVGPESELSSLNIINTEPLDVRDITSDTEKDVPLKIINRYSDISTNQVKVKIVLTSLNAERVLSDIPVEVRSLSGEMAKVTPSKVSVKISGLKDKVSHIKNDDIVPYVRLHKDSLDGNEYNVEIDAPKSITVITVEPNKVKVVRVQGGVKKIK